MGLFSFFKLKKDETAQEMTEERRRFPRKIKIYIAQCVADSRKSYMTVFNLSKNGLGIYLEEPIEKGSILKITLQHEFLKGSYNAASLNLTLTAKVIWVKENNNGDGFHAEELLGLPEMQDKKYCAGVELEPMDLEPYNRYAEIMNQLEDAPIQPFV
jgi:hypothetical protein